jgi:hypothetical protein
MEHPSLSEMLELGGFRYLFTLGITINYYNVLDAFVN